MGRPRGGLTSRFHAPADAEGHAVRLRLTGGLVHDACDAEVLIADIPHGATLLGDKGYDSTAIRAAAEARRIWAIFPTGPAASAPSAFRLVLPSRYPAECFFNHITQFRGIAPRYDREPANYLAAVKLISAHYGAPRYELAPQETAVCRNRREDRSGAIKLESRRIAEPPATSVNVSARVLQVRRPALK